MLKRDFRRIDGKRVLLVEQLEWNYSEPDESEFGSGVPKTITRLQRGRFGDTMVIRTDQGERSEDASLPVLTRDLPDFGDWRELLFAGDSEDEAGVARMSPGDDPFAMLAHISGAEGIWRVKPVLPQRKSDVRLVERFPPPSRHTEAAATLWSPPRPMQPDPRVLDLTGPKASLMLRSEISVVESHTAGMLRMPTGQVMAGAPDDYFLGQREPYTVSVPPGSYEFVLRVAHGANMDPRVAAAGFVIRKERVASWELAVVPGEDPRLLRDSEAYCFGVDGGTACFADASVTEWIASLWRDDEAPPRQTQVAGVRMSDAEDQESGANVIAFSSGWGDGCYPVWIGRTDGGSVACFVADMRLSD
ncbi:hypothetical protein B0293_31050 [Amycolatopsis azurea DSM 43854]|uniref:DUF4241 domain-containing protein n=1 Tax=Amycolatopsis azurea DSM 43854 TaxID=1238180 RepID=A0ABX3J6I3_9PSEU|nr:hypothetical protein B0293_31050 [Amycolatopsis azurea DSM 43854]